MESFPDHGGFLKDYCGLQRPNVLSLTIKARRDEGNKSESPTCDSPFGARR